MKRKFLLIALLAVVSIGYSQKKWSLQECVDEALKKNITVQQNKQNLLIAEKDVDISRGNFLPTLNSSFGQQISLGLSTGANNTRSSADRYNLSVGVNGGGTIFNGFRNLNTYKQAKLGVESSKLTLERIQNDISLFVVNGYLNILFAKENLNVAKVQAAISSKQVEAAQSRFDAGVIPKGDLLNVQSTAANDAQNVVTQENVLTIALLNLAQLLQVPTEGFDIEDINVGTPAMGLLYSSADMVYQKALTTQPQIKNAQIGIENADLSIDVAKGAFLPTVSYSFGANTFYNTVFGQPDVFDVMDGNGNVITIDNSFWNQLDNQLSYNLGLSVNIPIFNGFRTKNNVQRSIISRELSVINLENEKLQLQQTIEQAYVDTKAASKTFEAAKISLDSQKEAFRNAQESFNLGAMTLFDFDLVRNRLVNAESTLIRAKYDFVFKTKVLQFYYGELNLN